MSSLSKEVAELKELESRVNEKVQGILCALAKEIEDNPLDGVKTIGNSPRCATVSSSAIWSSGNAILSAEYYLPASQAGAVRERLEKCKSVQSVCSAVQQMLTEKKVKAGASVIYLNEKTLAILRASELAGLAKEVIV